jgi:hypothetical protein
MILYISEDTYFKLKGTLSAEYKAYLEYSHGILHNVGGHSVNEI